jgi:hypothetical protein
MQKNKIHWASLLILIVLGLSASFALLAAFGLGINSLIVLFNGEVDPAGQMIKAFTFGFEGVVLLLCCWFVLQKSMGREQAVAVIKSPLEGWHIAVVIILVLLSVAIGTAVVYTEVAWLAWFILPALTLIVIVPPIWLLFSIGSKGVELGQRWRVFGSVGLGMTLSPLVVVIVEVSLLAAGVILGAIFITVSQPNLVQEFVKLSLNLQYETDENAILSQLAPYISSPIFISLAVGYVAILVPLIEELVKPLAVWIFARRIASPAQGFVMGLLSGAAFALVESLNASGAGTESWPVIVSVRAGTSLLHITASGLVGWGIASAFRERRILRFFAAYFTAVLIHGIWNACAIGVGLSFIGEVVGKPEWFSSLVPAVGGMIVLGIGMFFVLVASNKKLRSPSLIIPPVLQDEGKAKVEGVQ